MCQSIYSNTHFLSLSLSYPYTNKSSLSLSYTHTHIYTHARTHTYVFFRTHIFVTASSKVQRNHRIFFCQSSYTKLTTSRWCGCGFWLSDPDHHSQHLLFKREQEGAFSMSPTSARHVIRVTWKSHDSVLSVTRPLARCWPMSHGTESL